MNMKTEHVMLACANKVPEILEALFLDGYSPNTSDSSGKSAMMMAARMNTNPDVIKMLRFYDAIWNNTDNEGRTVLHYAAANSDPAIYNWMLEDEDFILKSPVRRIHKVKTGEQVKEIISDENMEILRDNCKNIRDLAIIDLLSSTGMLRIFRVQSS